MIRVLARFHPPPLPTERPVSPRVVRVLIGCRCWPLDRCGASSPPEDPQGRRIFPEHAPLLVGQSEFPCRGVRTVPFFFGGGARTFYGLCRGSRFMMRDAGRYAFAPERGADEAWSDRVLGRKCRCVLSYGRESMLLSSPLLYWPPRCAVGADPAERGRDGRWCGMAWRSWLAAFSAPVSSFSDRGMDRGVTV